MKKHVFILATLLYFSQLTMSAQTEEGTWLLGGAANFSFRGGQTQSNYMTISPDVGYFLAKNAVLGGSVGYSFSQYISNTNTVSSHSLATTVFGRYYFSKSANTLKPFTQLSAGLSRSKTKYQQDEPTTYTSFLGVASGGFAYFLNKNTAIEATLNYQKWFGSFTTESFFMNIGFQIHFNNKKD